MAQHSFFYWLSDSLRSGEAKPFHLEDFSSEEVTIAKDIQNIFRKTNQQDKYAKAYLASIQGAENLSERSIKLFSALIRIIKLTARKDCSLDLERVCGEVLEIVSEELDMENCSIMLKDEDQESLRFIAGKGRGDCYKHSARKGRTNSIPIGKGIAGTVFLTGEHIFVPDTFKDKRFKSGDMNVNVTSLLCVPLKSNEEIIGVINFSHPQPEVFDHNSINLMLMLSNFIGQVITLVDLHNQLENWNVRLRQEVKEKTEELVKKNQKLQRIAVTDSLTSLYNRRFFFIRLEEEFNRYLRYDEVFSLLMIDFDNLKPINDTYGHAMGDMVLKRLARVLKLMGRKGDVMGRLGGDEFGYIFLDGGEEEAFQFAIRLQESLRHSEIKDTPITPTISIGIAMVKGCGFKKHLEIYRAADKALYKAKITKNTVCLYSQLNDKKKTGNNSGS